MLPFIWADTILQQGTKGSGLMLIMVQQGSMGFDCITTKFVVPPSITFFAFISIETASPILKCVLSSLLILRLRTSPVLLSLAVITLQQGAPGAALMLMIEQQGSTGF